MNKMIPPTTVIFLAQFRIPSIVASRDAKNTNAITNNDREKAKSVAADHTGTRELSRKPLSGNAVMSTVTRPEADLKYFARSLIFSSSA